jgi:MiaB-like tRNA modifying enzyme
MWFTMKVFIEAYGCALNRGEAAELADLMNETGHRIIKDENEAEAIIIFTCGVIETTERHMLRRIDELARSDGRLLICGCLGDISAEKIREVAPKASVFHPAEHAEVVDLLDGGKDKVGAMKHRDSAVGILPIATGCLGDCAYCITRLVRGSLSSRSVNDVIGRAGKLISDGAAEIQVCAQDTAPYGEDIGTDIAGLISELTDLNGDFMLRIGMMNPESALRRLEKIMTAYENKKVFKFLHLPVQSGSGRVLTGMGRRYTVDDFYKVVKTFKRSFPDGVLATDVIVGFPGESECDFAETIRLLKNAEPDIVNITRFSARPGTTAAEMGNKIVSRIAKERSRILTDLRFEIGVDKFKRFVGQNMRVLATEYRVPGTTFLRTIDYRPVVVENRVPLAKWYDVKITGTEKTHLLGIVV